MIGATQVSSENSNRIVEVRNLSKRFGPTSALANVSLDVCKNEAVLVAGPNGSGKSTLLKILCGIMRHSNKGRVCVLGLDPWKYRHVLFGKVAASFEDYSFPELVSGKDYLEFIARIRSQWDVGY